MRIPLYQIFLWLRRFLYRPNESLYGKEASVAHHTVHTAKRMNAPFPQLGSDTDEGAFVERFLRQNPGWLAERLELYRVLNPPARVHGERLADHMAAMLRAERAHAAAMAERADGVLAAGRAAAGLSSRVQTAVVALIRSDDPVDWASSEMPGILALDAAALCVEGRHPGARSLPPGAVARLLGGRDVVSHRPVRCADPPRRGRRARAP